MLANAIGELLPLTMAIALTPPPIVAIVLIVGGPRGRAAGPAFMLGWLLALTLLTSVAMFLFDKLGESGQGNAPIVYWLQVVVGLLLLWAALRQWQKRPRDDAEPAIPKWASSLSNVAPMRAIILGVAVSGANPKIIGLVFAAISSLAYLPLSAGDWVVAAVVFILLSSFPVIAVVIAHAAGGDKAKAGIDALKRFMLRNNNLILMVVFAFLGMSVLGNGIAGLGG